MPSVDTASQAGIYDSKMIANYVLTLAEKCAALQREFSACAESFGHGRRQINQAEQMMESMQASLAQFNGTLDGLGDQALQVRTTEAQRTAQMEKLRRDIALREELLLNLQAQSYQGKQENASELRKRIQEDRVNVVQQLRKVNKDIDQTSESVFEVEDELDKLRDLHVHRKQTDKETLATLQSGSVDVELQRRHVLSLRNDNVLSLTNLYASPAEYTKLKTEVDELRLKQSHMEKHIQMLLDERQLLRETADQVIERVHNLEMKARKETGDHGYNSYTTVEPSWCPVFNMPNMWHISRPLSIDQVKCLTHTPMYLTAPNVEETDDGPSTSTTNSHQMTTVLLD